MNRHDFLRLIGAEEKQVEYLPVACLLRSGYGCSGYYNAQVNAELSDTFVLLNAYLIEFGLGYSSGNRPTIHDFSEFLEEIVTSMTTDPEGDETAMPQREMYGKRIPLTAVAFEEVAIAYPVAQISTLMSRASKQRAELPTFLDLKQSEILQVLGTKLW